MTIEPTKRRNFPRTNTKAYKEAERRTAAWFRQRLNRNIFRQRLSGSSGQPGQTTSDTTDPFLYIEVKLRAIHQTRTLADCVALRAKIEDKIPVLILFDSHRPGFLACVHSDHLERFCDHMAAKSTEDKTDQDEPNQ